MTKKPDLQGANSYRLRMVFKQWYLHLLKDGVYFAELGPYDFQEANRQANKLGIPDEDKKDVPTHQRH